MATTVAMPQLGETVTEGTILSWAKAIGDTIAEDEVLVEISTDKVDTEVPSPVGGVVLDILVAEGDTVEVGTPLVVIGESGETPDTGLQTPAEPAPATAASEAPPAPGLQPAASEVPPASGLQPAASEVPPASGLQPPASEAPPASAAPPASGSTSQTVEMPQLGETVTEGTILSWAKAVGDTIAEDEVLLEISTDKVDTEVPSPHSGTILEILVPEGETVVVGTPLVVIGAAGAMPVATPDAAPAAASAAAPVTTTTAAPAATAATPEPVAATSPQASGLTPQASTGAFASPVVRKLAREHDVDLSQIAGTGVGGRVTRKDVEAYIASPPVQPAASSPPPAAVQPSEVVVAPAPAASSPSPVAAAAPASAAPVADVPTLPGDEVVDLDRLRVRIGENMIQNKRTAAHVWTSVEVDFERVERVRQAHKAAFKAREGFSLTYLPFISRATIDALHQYPVVNSSYYLEQKKAVFHRSINLGIAVDVNQKGLLVTAIKEADGLRMIGIARQIRELAGKARGGNLTPDDISGSTFTITNPGPFGSYMSAPIINVPNVAILSTDTIVKRPVVVTSDDGEDTIAIRHIGYLGLTWDHRAFDGSTAVLFLRRIKESIETWDWEQELA